MRKSQDPSSPLDATAPAGTKPLGLSRESIADAAIELIEQHGLERLSMRTLASTIGCGTMSLYSYVKNRDDLVESIVEAMVERSRLPDIASERFDSWQDLARALSHAYRDLAFRYPNAHELLALAPYDRGPAAPHLEALARAFQRAGLSEDRSYEALGALDAYVVGFLLASVRSTLTGGASPSESALRLRRLRSPETFDSGLEVFIRGFEQLFAEQASARAGSREDAR